jgi:hypothetical protein
LRKKPDDANNPDTITALLKELDEVGFIYRTRIDNKIDTNKRIIKRKLVQIVFFFREVIRFAQHFIAGKLLVVDNTFNTNKLRLPLLINMSIINSDKTFFYILSYCSDETAKSYHYFFQILREEI